MHEHYGIDLDEPGLLKSRSGRWLRIRIGGLIPIDSRLHMILYAPDDEE